MKKLLLPLLALIGGTAIGGGAAYGTSLIVRRTAAPAACASGPIGETSFVRVGKILAPLVTGDGRLSGYVSFEVQLEVPADKAPFVTDRLPLLLHAINMRTYRTPMAAGPDGRLPDIATFRALVTQVAPQAFGAGAVRFVAVTQATPA